MGRHCGKLIANSKEQPEDIEFEIHVNDARGQQLSSWRGSFGLPGSQADALFVSSPD